jgi:hypothetical protein
VILVRNFLAYLRGLILCYPIFRFFREELGADDTILLKNGVDGKTLCLMLSDEPAALTLPAAQVAISPPRMNMCVSKLV